MKTTAMPIGISGCLGTEHFGRGAQASRLFGHLLSEVDIMLIEIIALALAIGVFLLWGFVLNRLGLM
jgi:hypothetical protein